MFKNSIKLIFVSLFFIFTQSLVLSTTPPLRIDNFKLSDNTPFSHTWILGNQLSVRFQSDTPFEYTPTVGIIFSTLLPGLQEGNSLKGAPDLVITHTKSKAVSLTQIAGRINLTAPWCYRLPWDVARLIYGAARLEWLQKDIFPVSAACIGNEEEGYILLVGPSGCGKTSLALHNAIHHGSKIFSGEKTLLNIKEDGTLEAIAGTHTLIVPISDFDRWSSVPKEVSIETVEGLYLQLPEEYYTKKERVLIKQIYFVSLNDGLKNSSLLLSTSDLHTLYPFFLEQGDILLEGRQSLLFVGGPQALLDGTVSKEIRLKFAKKLWKSLQTIPVYKITDSLEGISNFIHSPK